MPIRAARVLNQHKEKLMDVEFGAPVTETITIERQATENLYKLAIGTEDQDVISMVSF